MENDNGFFVKVTLFKDQVNKAKWHLPFTDETYKQLSRSLGKIPYIDLTGKTPDEHKQFEANQLIKVFRENGIDDYELVKQIWKRYDREESGRKGKVVDIYDVEKKASYGGLLNECALSKEMVKQTNPEVAVLDFILKITDDKYKQDIKDGKIHITPSPSIYGTAKTVDGVDVYDPSQYLDFLHVANATIPANGEHAKMKAFCEGEQSSCKKKMANASLLINNSDTQDSNRMSENNSNQPSSVNPSEGITQQITPDQIRQIFDQYNVPKEIVTQFDKYENEVNQLKKSNEETSKKYEQLSSEFSQIKEREQKRLADERKALINKHINIKEHFNGNEESFTKKVEWVNKFFPENNDLSTYLNEAFPIKQNEESTKKETKDLPEKKQAYGGLFKTSDIVKEQMGETVSVEQSSNNKGRRGWASLLPLSISEY